MIISRHTQVGYVHCTHLSFFITFPEVSTRHRFGRVTSQPAWYP